MKSFIHTLIISLIIIAVNYSQQASDYFPASTGYTWMFRVVPLDSSNNPIDSLTFFRADSFATVANYQGKSANYVLTKQGAEAILPSLPYSDTLFYSFEGSNGFEYFRLRGIDEIARLLDSIGIGGGDSLLQFFTSLKDWYSTFRFASAVNQNYTLFSKDTTIIIDTLTLPLRFEYRGRRLNDESINTDFGVLNCKKFLLSNRISYLILPPPPIPPIPITLIEIPDTVWIAQDLWIVRDVIPASTLDLSLFGFESFTFPGLKTEIMMSPTSYAELNQIMIKDYRLSQNYPNPFNPSTTIEFTIPTPGYVRLTVTDILGQQVAEIQNRYFETGSFNVVFDAASLASGTYFYRLEHNNNVLVRKMILLK